MFEGFLEVGVRHGNHGDTSPNGYPSTRVPGPKNPAGFGSDPDPVTGRVRGNPPGTQVRHERVAPLILITASIS